MAMGRLPRSRGPILAAAFTVLWAAGCPGRDAVVTVSGKTVYGELAVEGVAVTALRREAGAWGPAGAARSGYHGSWFLRLAAGAYRLEAEGSLPAEGGGSVLLSGKLDGIHLAGDEGRVDRLLIRLEPTGRSTP